MTKKKELKWYETLEPSYINERLWPTGEVVQYDGEAGPNLRELSDKEVKQHLKADQIDEPDEGDLDAREVELNKREQEIILREQAVTAKELELGKLQESSDLRVTELDAREKDVAAKEAALVDKAKK